jgi:sec-independent protein translocase protein TatA
MPSLGAPELIIILVIVIVIFGVGRLPEVGSALGRGMKEFRRAQRDEDQDAEATVATSVEPPPPPESVVESGEPVGSSTDKKA